MEKFERELDSERLSKKEVSLGGKKQQLYYHEDLLVSYCCNCDTDVAAAAVHSSIGAFLGREIGFASAEVIHARVVVESGVKGGDR